MGHIDLAKLVKEEFAAAEARVELGKTHIARQMNLLDLLRRHGHDTGLAETLLQTFRESQTLHEADADRLWCELVTWKGSV